MAVRGGGGASWWEPQSINADELACLIKARATACSSPRSSSLAGNVPTSPKSAEVDGSTEAAALELEVTPEPAAVAVAAAGEAEAYVGTPPAAAAADREACDRSDKRQRGQCLLLLDARPFSEYSISHIASALSVRLSSILIRRLSSGKRHVTDLLVAEQQEEYKQRVRDCGGCFHVVVYDSSSTTADLQAFDEKAPLPVILKSFHNDGIDAAFLNGGLDAFEHAHPDCMGSDDVVPTPSPFNEPVPARPESPLTRRHYTQEKKGPTEILPFLLIGAEFHVKNEELLRSLGITAVLNVTSHDFRPSNPALKYKQIPVRDSWNQNLMEYLDEAFAFLDSVEASGGKVLVHCVAGISRSPALTIAYIMQKRSVGLTDAYAFVRDKRPTISPNLDFMGELQMYEKRLQMGDKELQITSPAILADVDSDDGRDSKQSSADDDMDTGPGYAAHDGSGPVPMSGIDVSAQPLLTPVSTTAQFVLPG
eukprot:m.72948 g.72948  ORF g.72948 m.72948 type:complete len:480 (+) comp14291_c0_seq1:144-1583(+)